MSGVRRGAVLAQITTVEVGVGVGGQQDAGPRGLEAASSLSTHLSFALTWGPNYGCRRLPAIFQRWHWRGKVPFSSCVFENSGARSQLAYMTVSSIRESLSQEEVLGCASQGLGGG